MNTRTILSSLSRSIANNVHARTLDNIQHDDVEARELLIYSDLAPTFALVAQSGIRVTELMVILASLGESGHDIALSSFNALAMKNVELCEKAIKSFSMTRNKMVNPKQKSYDANVERTWGETSIRLGKNGLPELYSPKRRNGSGIDQNATTTATATATATATVEKRTPAHARAILRAWKYRATMRAMRASIAPSTKKARKRSARTA
jgi:hypothetical protein